jgi:hypothetical protein
MPPMSPATPLATVFGPKTQALIDAAARRGIEVFDFTPEDLETYHGSAQYSHLAQQIYTSSSLYGSDEDNAIVLSHELGHHDRFTKNPNEWDTYYQLGASLAQSTRPDFLLEMEEGAWAEGANIIEKEIDVVISSARFIELREKFIKGYRDLADKAKAPKCDVNVAPDGTVTITDFGFLNTPRYDVILDMIITRAPKDL